MQAADTVLLGSRVVTMDNAARFLPDGGLARDGAITAVGSRDTIAAAYRAPRIIDTRATPDHPGLIDAHAYPDDSLPRAGGRSAATPGSSSTSARGAAVPSGRRP
jgi:cytosine/adenosine deaminase-related metal-dependent hydrolase